MFMYCIFFLFSFQMSFQWLVRLLLISFFFILDDVVSGEDVNSVLDPNTSRERRSFTGQDVISRQYGSLQGLSRRLPPKSRERRESNQLRDVHGDLDDFQKNDFSTQTGNNSDLEKVSLTTGTRLRRSIVEIKSYESFSNPIRVLMESVIKLVAENHFLIIFHDSHPHTMDDLDHLLREDAAVPLLLLDMTSPDLPQSPFLGDYNDGFDIHILLFRNIEVVADFADSLPDRVWAPRHLLLINANLTAHAGNLLAHESFGRSPFLTLLQRDLRVDTITSFLILTHESFRSEKKVVSRGFYRLDGGAPSFDTLFPDRFTSFYGFHFHLSSWADDFPYTVTGETLEDTYGMCIYMLDAIAERLNFTYQVRGWIITQFI